MNNMAITEITIDGTRYEVRAIPNTPKPKEDKPDWEIVSYCYGHDGSGRVYKNGSSIIGDFQRNFQNPLFWESKGNKIHSVKRISDGEIFSIGDECAYKFGKDKIASFDIDKRGGQMYARSERDYFIVPINDIEKSKPKEQPPQRIEVSKAWRAGGAISNYDGNAINMYQFNSISEIHETKFPAIKQAIEQVLNDEPRKYTQQVDELCEGAFYAARETTEHLNPENILGRTYTDKTFATYKDYKNSKL